MWYCCPYQMMGVVLLTLQNGVCVITVLTKWCVNYCRYKMVCGITVLTKWCVVLLYLENGDIVHIVKFPCLMLVTCCRTILCRKQTNSEPPKTGDQGKSIHAQLVRREEIFSGLKQFYPICRTCKTVRLCHMSVYNRLSC